MLLGTEEGIQVVGEAVDGQETLARVEALKPDVLLLGACRSSGHEPSSDRGKRE